MTLSSHTKTIEPRSSRKIRLAIVGTALAVAGLVAPAAALADWDTLDPDQTAQQRSIALIEGMNPANSPTATAAFDPPTQNERSIALTESKEATGGTAFDPPTANERSIALTESKEAPGGMLAGGVPETVRIGYW